MFATSSAVSQIALCRSAVFPGALTHASFKEGVEEGEGGVASHPLSLSFSIFSLSLLTHGRLSFCLVIASQRAAAHLESDSSPVVCEHVGR